MGKGVRCFLGQIVAGSRDHSTLIRAGKVGGVLEGAFRRREAAAVAMQYDRRYRNTRLGGQPPFDRLQARIAVGVAERVTAGGGHCIRKVWSGESGRWAVVRRV